METMLKIKAGIMRVLSIVIIFLFAFMTVIGTYQIVTRYFFNKPSTVSEELLTYHRVSPLGDQKRDADAYGDNRESGKAITHDHGK